MPADVVADNFPVVAGVTLARVIAVRGYFLVAAERAREDVRVEVFVGGHVRESDYVSAFDLLSPLANFSRLSFDHPVRVDLEKSIIRTCLKESSSNLHHRSSRHQ